MAKNIVTIIGAVTALFAATVGLAQNDIKRVIAYSTCSQLGYMFFAAGVGAYQAAMFHLFTHAFFKALLFLGAGSVITRHAPRAGHAEDGRALRSYMPVTYAVMTDRHHRHHRPRHSRRRVRLRRLLLQGRHHRGAPSRPGQDNPVAYFAFVVGVLAAGLTAFYSWRLVFFTFNGHARWGHGRAAHDAAHAHAPTTTPRRPDRDPFRAARRTPRHDHGHGHGHKPHESPWVMLVPLLVLSVGAIAAGFVFDDQFIGERAAPNSGAGAIFTGAAQPRAGRAPPRADLGDLGAAGGHRPRPRWSRPTSTC